MGKERLWQVRRVRGKGLGSVGRAITVATGASAAIGGFETGSARSGFGGADLWMWVLVHAAVACGRVGRDQGVVGGPAAASGSGEGGDRNRKLLLLLLCRRQWRRAELSRHCARRLVVVVVVLALVRRYDSRIIFIVTSRGLTGFLLAAVRCGAVRCDARLFVMRHSHQARTDTDGTQTKITSKSGCLSSCTSPSSSSPSSSGGPGIAFVQPLKKMRS